MKKLLVIGAAVAMLLLASCGKTTGTCEMCGKEGSGEEISYQGEKAFFCDDCSEGIKGLIDLAESLS